MEFHYPTTTELTYFISEYHAKWKSVVRPLWKGMEQAEQGGHLFASSGLSSFL